LAVFWLLGLATLGSMSAALWWALKHGRTSYWAFGIGVKRAERPILYWLQIICYGACVAVVASFLAVAALSAISTEAVPDFG